METKKNRGELVVAFVLSVFVAVIVGAGGVLLVFHFFPDFARNTVTNITKTEKEVTVTDNGIADAVEKVYDSVVVIETYKKNQLYATGTGFVYKKDKNVYYLLTNYHVIQGGTEIKAVFTDGNETKVEIVGGDKYADIAVLSYETSKELSVVTVGDTSKMRVGDTVFAIGAPLDSSVYSWTVTRGILSGKDREIAVSTTNGVTSDWIMQALQTDAAINSGNSGGPLCNSNGEVIGITNMKLVTTGVEGMGFAIPIEIASSYAESLIKGEDISRPQIGIYMTDASIDQVVQQYGYTAGMDGVIITEVGKGSPAEKAGLKAGDIITALGSKKVKDTAELRFELYKHKVGEKITFTYKRQNKTLKAEVTLASATDS